MKSILKNSFPEIFQIVSVANGYPQKILRETALDDFQLSQIPASRNKFAKILKAKPIFGFNYSSCFVYLRFVSSRVVSSRVVYSHLLYAALHILVQLFIQVETGICAVPDVEIFYANSASANSASTSGLSANSPSVNVSSVNFFPVNTSLDNTLLNNTLLVNTLLDNTESRSSGGLTIKNSPPSLIPDSSSSTRSELFEQNLERVEISREFSNGGAQRSPSSGSSLLQSIEAGGEFQAQEPRMGVFALQHSEIIGLFAVPNQQKQFFSVSSDGRVAKWDLRNDQQQEIFPAGEPIAAAAFDASSSLLAVSQDTGIYLYDVEQKRRLARSPSLGTKSAVLDFAPDSKSLLIGGEDGKVYRWRLNSVRDEDPKRRIDVERYIGHSAAVSALAYHPFSRIFFSADSFGNIAAWLTYDKDLFGGKYDQRQNQTTFYAEDGPRALVSTPEATTVLSLRVSKDGQNVFAALQDGKLEWRLVRGLRLVISSKANKGAIYDMQISPSGKLVATVARDGVMRVFNLKTLQNLGDRPSAKGAIAELNDFKKDSLGYLEIIKELALPDARKLLFLSDETLVVAESNGRLLEVKL